MKNYYDILGLPRTANQEDIKTAYRKLSLKFHPDKNDGEQYFSEMFRQVNESYSTLYNPTQRAAYDKKLFEFENPIKSYTSTPSQPRHTSSAFKNYNQQPANYKKQTYSNPISVWDSVKKWQNFRNIMLLVNVLLVVLLIIIHNSSTGATQANSLDTARVNHNIKHKKHRTKRHGTNLLPIDTSKQDTSVKFVNNKPLDTRDIDKINDTTKLNTTKDTVQSNDTLKSINPKKRDGFFKRLFGKKKN